MTIVPVKGPKLFLHWHVCKNNILFVMLFKSEKNSLISQVYCRLVSNNTPPLFNRDANQKVIDDIMAEQIQQLFAQVYGPSTSGVSAGKNKTNPGSSSNISRYSPKHVA